MLNNSPWLFNASQTAGNMTARTSNGIHILQAKRAKDTFTPSPLTLQAQAISGQVWSIWRTVPGFIREWWKVVATGRTASNEFYAWMYANGFDKSSPPDFVNQYNGWAFARGYMTPTALTAVTADVSDGFVTFSWPTALSDESQSATDVAWYVVRNSANGEVFTGSTGPRSDGASGNIVAPTGFMSAGNLITAYVHFAADVENPTAYQVSNSAYGSATATA